MPFWGASQNSEPDDRDAASPARRSEDGVDANERTRLLPAQPQPPAQPALYPDDPAVSPFNLWTVRLMRNTTTVLALLTLAWWMIIFISTFITIPGLHVRESPYYSFAYVSLTLLIMIMTVAFFNVPAQGTYYVGCVTMFIIALHAIVTVSVPKLRHGEGVVGIVTVLWAFFMSMWIVLAQRLVKWAKMEEEQRLTGRVETRRTAGEWSKVVTSTVCFVAVLVVSVILSLTMVARCRDASQTAPGEMVWVDGYKYQMHVYCGGNATDSDKPTVLLEGGSLPVGGSLQQFAEEAVGNGTFSRYCFVDRPGIGWSDAAPSPLSVGLEVTAASEALVRAGERGPFVIVAAGSGALYARVFAAQHDTEVAGLVLVDPLTEDYLVDLGGQARGFWLWVRGVTAPFLYTRHRSKFYYARLQESLAATSLSAREIESARVILDAKTRVAVVSSGKRVKSDERWEAAQRDMTKLSRSVAWDVVAGAGHRVWENETGEEVLRKRVRAMVRGKEVVGEGDQ